MVLFFTHTRSWWITQSTQHHLRGCKKIPSFLQRTTPIARSLCEGLNLARPPHPGHSTILLRSEIPSGMSAKLHTVAASNNRVHMPWSLYDCLFATHICMVLFFTHIPFVVNHTFNSTPPERLQHNEHSHNRHRHLPLNYVHVTTRTQRYMWAKVDTVRMAK